MNFCLLLQVCLEILHILYLDLLCNYKQINSDRQSVLQCTKRNSNVKAIRAPLFRTGNKKIWVSVQVRHKSACRSRPSAVVDNLHVYTVVFRMYHTVNFVGEKKFHFTHHHFRHENQCEKRNHAHLHLASWLKRY